MEEQRRVVFGADLVNAFWLIYQESLHSPVPVIQPMQVSEKTQAEAAANAESFTPAAFPTQKDLIPASVIYVLSAQRLDLKADLLQRRFGGKVQLVFQTMADATGWMPHCPTRGHTRAILLVGDKGMRRDTPPQALIMDLHKEGIEYKEALSLRAVESAITNALTHALRWAA